MASGGDLLVPPAQTLDEAYTQIAERLAAEGHGRWLSLDEREWLVENACVASTTECEAFPRQIEIVVARGPSMMEPSVAEPGVTRWQLVQELLTAFVEELQGASVGLSFSPPLAPQSCGTLVPAVERQAVFQQEGHRSVLRQAILAAEPADSGVALSDAYEAALERLGEQAHGVVLLVTDGTTDLLAGCSVPADGQEPLPLDLPAAVLHAAEGDAGGVSTLIIGTPGSDGEGGQLDARDFLSEIASVGNRFPCQATAGLPFQHLDMTGPAPVLPLLLQTVHSSAGCGVNSFPTLPPFDDEELQEVHFFIDSSRGTFLLSEAPEGCGLGFSTDGERNLVCPQTFSLLSCLPPPSFTEVGICEDDLP